jgi:uncharacterized protein (DUF1697 family)
MPRYAAFLRGVMPMNAKMPELKAAFEAAGFKNVKTLLGSGNVVFDAAKASEASIQKKAEAAMEKRLGRTFLTIVRAVDTLRDILASDPYSGFPLEPGSKRVVTFLREAPTSKFKLPITMGSATIVSMNERQLFSVYVRGASSPEFMVLIEKTFGKALTTRTWETVTKAAL